MAYSELVASIGTSLESYHNQLTALSRALDALRGVTDHMISALERDRAALATHITPAGTGAPLPTETAAEAISGTPEKSDVTSPATEPSLAGSTQAADDEAPRCELVELPAATSTEAGAAAASNVPASPDDPTPEDRETVIAATLARIAAERKAAAEATAPAVENSGPIAAATAVETTDAATPTAADEKKVVELEAYRRLPGIRLPSRRRAIALTTGLLVMASATLGFHEVLQTELGQRLLELGTCDGDMMSANRDCALLAWLLI